MVKADSLVKGLAHLLCQKAPATSARVQVLHLVLASSSFSVFQAISLGLTILLLCSQLDLWGSPFFFFFCVPSYISGAHHSSSSVFPAISLGFTILLLLLCTQLYLWGSPFFFFCVPSYISGARHSSSCRCVPSYISGVHHSSSCCCVPSYISEAHHSSCSFSVFPAISLGFTILLLLLVFPAISLGLTIPLLLLCSQLYLWGSPFFFYFCVPSYISGLTILGDFFAYRGVPTRMVYLYYIIMLEIHHSGWEPSICGCFLIQPLR